MLYSHRDGKVTIVGAVALDGVGDLASPAGRLGEFLAIAGRLPDFGRAPWLR
ncbi:hypothetical protein [Streptomyces sp. B6B3]|uniref:hypothetical protein n=1 Tax=Streptomyces sp. B6B3 TaxID=3153570 RepID=UPI00325CB4C4